MEKPIGLSTKRIARLGASPSITEDALAVEEPLEIRIGRRPFAVTMRTPGDDIHLVAGFLASERIVRAPEDLLRIVPCPETPPESGDNVVEVTLAGEAPFRWSERATAIHSSCGLCGKERIEDLRADIASLANDPLRMGFDLLAALPDRLRGWQSNFERTGGLHAAGLANANGTIVDAAEDIGRHNAVDKVLGRAFLGGRWPLSGQVLTISGRASFEIVQKAAIAGVPIVVAVSAPSSLAVELATELGMTLLGFVRNGSGNVYSGAERVAG